MKGCALDLILKVRVFGTLKWPSFIRLYLLKMNIYMVYLNCIFQNC